MLKGVKKDSAGKTAKAKLKLNISSSESESEDTDNQDAKGGSKKEGGLTINKNYAERYDNWRNLEEMQKLKNRLGVQNLDDLNDVGSSSESSSEEEDEWSPEREKAFLKTLACLKKKDPKIYDEQFGFFKGVAEEDKEGEGGANEVTKKKKEDKKPFTVRDHERVMVLEKGGQFSDEEEEDEDKMAHKPLSYHEELQSIKTEFSKALNDSSDDEGGDTLLGGKLLKKRSNKTDEEKLQDDEEYKLWLKGELDKVNKAKLSKEDVKELKFLREYWNDDKLDEGEKFLRDYILNKKYIEPLNIGGTDYIPSFNEVVHDDDELSNDEKFEEEREVFEHKYNFRFEEPDPEFIKRYPRTIQDSLRREENKRKEQRDKAKERKEEAKARKHDEVQRLKALKRKEIMDKIQKLHEITGNPDLELTEKDIEGDFDPEEYDRRMQQLFSDDYYQEEVDVEKPVFSFDEEIDDDEENWDDWVPPSEARGANEEVEGDDMEDSDDDSQNGVAGSRKSTQQELIEASKGKRGRKKRSVFLDVLEREKPKFDPKVHKSFEKYFDEYYKLDFEDLVGDLPCRFKYHKTTPNDFGLSVDEILKAEDRELNQWASLKKAIQYRGDDEEEYEVKAYKKKGEREDLKKRVLLSVYQPSKSVAQGENDETETSEQSKKKRKKKNKKKNKKRNNSATVDSEDSEVEENICDSVNEEPQEHDVVEKKKKSKKPNGIASAVSEDSQNEDNFQDEINSIQEPDLTEKKSKKKNKKPNGNATTTCEDSGILDTIPNKSKDNLQERKSPEKKKKRKLEESLEKVSESDNITSSPVAKLSKRQRKNLAKKKAFTNDVGSISSSNGSTKSAVIQHKAKEDLHGQKHAIDQTLLDNTSKQNKNKKWKGLKRKAESNDTSSIGVDDERLKAYGINPKKFKKQMKYGASFAKS